MKTHNIRIYFIVRQNFDHLMYGGTVRDEQTQSESDQTGLVTPDISICGRQLFTFSVDMARVHSGSRRTEDMTESLSTVAVEPIHDSSDYNERTQNVLVILTDTEVDQRLIHEAGAYAAGIGSHLILLSVMPSREFEERQRVYAQTRDLPRYSLPQARETCRQSALRSSRELLNTLDPDIEYTAVGAVGRETDQVLATARAYDCGHVFLVDQPRSLLRRFLGSGGIRAITRGFDGLVTTLREPHHL